MTKTKFKFEGLIQNGISSYHIHRELHKHLNFHDKFELGGQGQGHLFSNPSETFRCSINWFKLEGKIQNGSMFKS